MRGVPGDEAYSKHGPAASCTNWQNPEDCTQSPCCFTIECQSREEDARLAGEALEAADVALNAGVVDLVPLLRGRQALQQRVGQVTKVV